MPKAVFLLIHPGAGFGACLAGCFSDMAMCWGRPRTTNSEHK